MATSGSTRIASGLNILAGIWVFFSPWIFGYAGDAAALWSSLMSGAIIVLIGAYRTFAPGANPGWSWVNFIVGLWVIITPWVYGYAFNGAAVWDKVIAGIIIAFLALVSALSGRTGYTREVPPPRI